MNAPPAEACATWIQPGMRRVVAEELKRIGRVPEGPTDKVVILDHLSGATEASAVACSSEDLLVLLDDALVVRQTRPEWEPAYGWFAKDTPESKEHVMKMVNQGQGRLFSTKGVHVRVDGQLLFIELSRQEDDHLIKLAEKQCAEGEDLNSKHLSQDMRQRVIFRGRHYLCGLDSRSLQSSKCNTERAKAIHLISQEVRRSHVTDNAMMAKILQMLQSDQGKPRSRKRAREAVSDEEDEEEGAGALLSEASVEQLVNQLVHKCEEEESEGASARDLAQIIRARRARLVKEGKFVKPPWMNKLANLVLLVGRRSEGKPPGSVLDLLGVPESCPRKDELRAREQAATKSKDMADFEQFVEECSRARTAESPSLIHSLAGFAATLGLIE